MIIRFFHAEDSISADQYRKFTKEEFLRYINKIASEMTIHKDIFPWIIIQDKNEAQALGSVMDLYPVDIESSRI